jgi:hypothetical protein
MSNNNVDFVNSVYSGSVYANKPPKHVKGWDWERQADAYNKGRLTGVVNNFSTPYDPQLRVSKVLSEHPYNPYIESCVKVSKGKDWARLAGDYNKNRLAGIVNDQRFNLPNFLPPTVPNRKGVFDMHFENENLTNPFKKLGKQISVAVANYHREQHEDAPDPRPPQPDAMDEDSDAETSDGNRGFDFDSDETDNWSTDGEQPEMKEREQTGDDGDATEVYDSDNDVVDLPLASSTSAGFVRPRDGKTQRDNVKAMPDGTTARNAWMADAKKRRNKTVWRNRLKEMQHGADAPQNTVRDYEQKHDTQPDPVDEEKLPSLPSSDDDSFIQSRKRKREQPDLPALSKTRKIKRRRRVPPANAKKRKRVPNPDERENFPKLSKQRPVKNPKKP